MAKSKNGGGSKGGDSKGSACAAQGAIDRKKIADQAKAREQRRQEEGSAFFLRLNADRNNNPADIANGVVGKYAIPGGDKPSVHLAVRNHAQANGSFPVVEFESVQRGHVLQGATLNAGIFLGTRWIGNMEWCSRMTGSARTTQQNLHGYLSQFIELVPVDQMDTHVEPAIIAPKLTLADIESLTKAEAKRQRRKANNAATPTKKIAAASEKAAEATMLHAMRKQAIHPFEFATGTIGYCDLSSNHGELIVLSFVDGGDRKVSIAYLSKSHILTLAGVKVDDAIFASYVMAGRVHESDRSHMNKDDFDRRNAIAKYIHDQLANRGIRFPAGNKQKA